MILAAILAVYLFVGVVVHLSLLYAHAKAGVEFKVYWPARWERIGITLVTVAAWPYVLYSWFVKPEIEIPER